MTCGRCGDTQWIGSDECMWCSDPAPQNGAPREEIVLLRRMGRPRRPAMSAVMLAAMLAWGVGGARVMPLRPRDEGYDPTDADKERLRLAEERRQRKAARKAENARRSEMGKRPTGPSSAAAPGERSTDVR
jgi:hypothetical protein